jgi:ACT domain-containing protein
MLFSPHLKENPMKAIVVVLGKDRVGIIAAVSRILADNRVNILDISQTTQNAFFTMLMQVELAPDSPSLKELNEIFVSLRDSMNLDINVYHEDIFNAMHRI